MGRAKVHRWCDAHLPCFVPSRGAQAPFVPGFEAREPELRPRRDEIIAAIEAVIQELGRDGHANCVQTLIHRACIAASITEKSGQGIMTAGLQFAAQDVPRSLLLRCHSAGTTIGLLAADLITPQ